MLDKPQDIPARVNSSVCPDVRLAGAGYGQVFKEARSHKNMDPVFK